MIGFGVGRPGGTRLALALAVVIAIVVGACSGPILANSPAAQPVVPTSSPRAATPPDPQPVVFPRDDGPHHRDYRINRLHLAELRRLRQRHRRGDDPEQQRRSDVERPADPCGRG